MFWIVSGITLAIVSLAQMLSKLPPWQSIESRPHSAPPAGHPNTCQYGNPTEGKIRGDLEIVTFPLIVG